MPVDERLPEPSNPLGLDGIEFVEYATSQAQAFGAVLQKMGFAAVARHRSREVVLYRQGPMSLVVNSHAAASPAPVDVRPRRGDGVVPRRVAPVVDEASPRPGSRRARSMKNS